LISKIITIQNNLIIKKVMHWVIAAILICGATVLTACTSIEDNAGAKNDSSAKKALLIILDGWGIGNKDKADVMKPSSWKQTIRQRLTSIPDDSWPTMPSDCPIC